MVKPLSFQSDAIAHHVQLLRDRRASAEASVAGFGKTFVAAFVAREMETPMVVCCPKAVIPHWKAAADAVGAPIRYISNYEQHKLSNTGMGGWRIRNRQWEWRFPKPTLLVLDEAHVCKTRTSQNAKLVVAARRQGIPTLAMSATLAQDPLDLYALGYLLGLHTGETFDFRAWTFRYGVRPANFDFVFDPKADPTALDRLHRDIFPAHGHRKTYADIPGFPDGRLDVIAVPGDPKKIAAIDSLWAKIAEIETKAADARTSMTERLRARQIAELAKVPAIVEMTEGFLEAGLSVPIFLNFHDTIDAVASHFPKFPIIDGRNSGEAYRAAAIADFQADRRRGMIIQVQSGGVGISLHDTIGRFPRHSIISPPESARDFLQCLGRNRRAGGKTPAFRTVLTLADSVEQKVARKVQARAQQIETINDGRDVDDRLATTLRDADLDPLAA